MNPIFKAILVISAKQALGAVIGNGTLMALMPKTFNFHDPAGTLALLKATAAVVLAAEGKVWIPRLLKWVNSPTTGLEP